jgi:hypothetical protein
MISFEERVEDCWLTVNADYGVSDRLAIEILLAAQVECPLPYPWLIVETTYYSLNTEQAWFNLQGAEVIPLPMMRVMHSRKAGDILMRVLNEKGPKVFVEPNYTLPVFTRPRLYPYLLQRCSRLRVKNPATVPVNEAGVLRLREATKRALDTRWRGQPPLTLPDPPRSLLYWSELLQRLSPSLRDWETLVRSLIALAARRAYLYDRPVDESDWAAVARVMSDSIPYWTTELLKEFHRGRMLWVAFKKLMPEKILMNEWRRLKSTGILYMHGWTVHLQQRDKLNEDVLALVNGEVEL